MDESLTSGGSYFALSRGCPQFGHLTLTGRPLLPQPLPLLLPLPLRRCQRLHPAPSYSNPCNMNATVPFPPPMPVPLCAGGAIGAGIPLAVGAAVACPDRVVINLQVGEVPQIVLVCVNCRRTEVQR